MHDHARSRVAVNAAVGTVAQIATIVVGLITTPQILHSLGTTEFGGFALIASLTTYFGVLDLGIGGSLTRFMAFYEGRGDRDRLRAFATFGLLFYVAFTVIVLPVLLIAAPAVGHFLALPPDLLAQFPALLVAVFALFIGWAVNSILIGRLAAVHRLDVSGYATIAGTAVYALGIYVWMPRVGTIASVLVCIAANMFTVMAVLYVANRRINGPLVASPRLIRWPEIRELFSFSLWSQLATITAVINLEADKAIISRGIGVAQVTPYHVANRLALLSRALPLQLLGSLLPAITAQVSRGVDATQLKEIYAGAARGLMIPTILIVGFVAGSADALLRLWLGAELPGAGVLCVALVLSYAVNNVTGPGTVILKAEGAPQLETFYGILSAVLNIGLTILLIGPYGLYGVVTGTIVGNVTGSLVFVALFHHRKQFAWWSTIGHWLVKLVLAAAIAGLGANLLLGALVPGTINRLMLLPALTVAGLVYLACFYLVGRMTRLWIPTDRAFMDRAVGALRRRRAKGFA